MTKEKEKKKIEKTCNNCARLYHDLCKTPDKKCSRWIYKKRTCIDCSFAYSCILLDKNNPSCFGFCESFKKAEKKNPTSIFKDEDEYKIYLEDRSKKKAEKKKKKTKFDTKKGKTELKLPILDKTTLTPIKSPKVKVAKKRKLLDPTLQDKDRAEWSPMDRIEEIVSRNYDPEAFALVDERDLPKSDNIIKFIVEPNFLNQPLYPRQLQISLDLFQAYCPDCSDTDWVRNKIQVDEKIENIFDRVTLYSNGVCPKCGKTRYDAVKEHKHILYTTLNLAVGQRSGKTAYIWMVAPAIIHEYLQIPNPAKFMRQLDVTEFHATFISVTAEDAYKNVWSPMDNVFTWSPWYRMYHQFLDEEGKRIGTELYKHMDTFIAYHHKGIYASSGNADFRKLRGKCITGDMLITTINGTFKAIDLYRKRILFSVPVGTKVKPMVAIEKQKEKKEVVKIYFYKRHSLKATFDHRIPVWNEKGHYIHLVQAGRIKNKWCIHQIGTKFPKRYIFNIKPYIGDEVRSADTARLIAGGRVFTAESLCRDLGKPYNNMGMYGVREMIKAGVVTPSPRQTTSDGKTAPSYYRINKKFKLKDWIHSHNRGKISDTRKKITIPTEVTPELGRLIGYLVTDGSIYSSQNISYDTTSVEKYEDVIHLVKKIFGIEPRAKKDRTPNYTSGWYCRVEISYKKIIHFFKEIGFWGQKAYTKKLPDCIMQGPREAVVECLSAMLSSDGGFECPRTSKKQSYSLFYRSKSKVLLNQVHILFGNLGFFAKKSKRGVTLLKYETTLFLKEYTGLRKYTFREDYLPVIPEGKKHFYPYRIPGTPYFVRSDINKRFGIDNIPKKYKKYIDHNIMFVKATKVKHLGKKTVYDIEIDSRSHLFPANNILVHNTRIIGGMDEPSYLTGDKILMNAWQAYDALNNSLSTIQSAHEAIFPRFPWAPTAYCLCTSSTRSKQDFIMGMHKRARRVSSILSRKMATWEFNPNMPKDCDFIKNKYIEDFVAAERDYASNPPFASDPYIRKASQIVPILSKRANVLAIDRIKITKDSLGGKALYPTIKCTPHNYPCVLSIDAGYRKNSFALALTHRLPDKDDPDLYTIATSGLLEITPREGIPISYSKVYDEVIVPIIKKFNVVLFATDQWQGLDLQSRVYNDFEIDSIQYSVKYDDFEQLRTYINSETWELPKLDGELKEILAMEKDLVELVHRKPVSHLMLQLLLSKDTGKSVVKNTDAGEDFTDDLLRASVLGVSLLENDEYAALFEDSDGKFGHYEGAIGASSSFSGGSNTSYVPGLGISVRLG